MKMKALVFKGVGNIALENVPDPEIKNEHDVIVKITKTTICGTDLHAVRGSMPGMKPGTIIGHEGVGIVEKKGTLVKNFAVGDRVVIASTVACGGCSNCKKGLFSQCDVSNPAGPHAGTAFYGGPITTGDLQGMQAEKVRVPYADVSLVKLPDDVTDDQAILLSDIMPTSYMAIEMADLQENDSVAVFGCGPVGQIAIAFLKQFNVSPIFAIDNEPSRLAFAKEQGAQIINFNEKDPVETLRSLTNKKGPSKIIDAVGTDAMHPDYGLLGNISHMAKLRQFKNEVASIVPKSNPNGGNWYPGNAPSQVFEWAVEAVEKGGTISIIGVYTELMRIFPIGEAMGKNLTVRAGNCNHRKYMPMLLEMIRKGTFDPLRFLTQKMPFDEIVTAYKHFDKRDKGWLKIVLTV